MKAFRKSARMSSSRRLFWGMIFTFLITGGLLSLGVFLFSPDSVSASLFLAVSLRSSLLADYSPDARGALLPQMDLGLALEAARDRVPTAMPSGEPSLAPVDPEPTLVEFMKTPVPTVTPGELNFPATRTPAPTAEIIVTGTPFASATAGSQATLNASPTASSAPSATPGTGPTTAPTRTLVPLTPTRTLVQQTATHTPVQQNPTHTLLPPTSTPQPPTKTPVVVPPTQTQVPIPPTNTPIPPTPVPPTSVPTTPPQPTDPPPPTAYPQPTDLPPEPTAYP